MTTNEQLTTEQQNNEHVYNIDLPYISIHYCKYCSRFFNGDFGQSYLDACDPCIETVDTCDLCDYCIIHSIHSGKKHNYDFDSCWKCESNFFTITNKHRIKIGNVSIGSLDPGKWVKLNFDDEYYYLVHKCFETSLEMNLTKYIWKNMFIGNKHKIEIFQFRYATISGLKIPINQELTITKGDN